MRSENLVTQTESCEVFGGCIHFTPGVQTAKSKLRSWH